MTRRGAGGPSPSGPAPELRLRVDPVACDGIALCAHLAPNAVELDRWGFPIVVGRDLAPDEVAAARRAVRACPRQALWIESAPVPASHQPAGVTTPLR